MKQSYFRTPRTLDECHFTPGYRPALPRDHWTDVGHWLLAAFCVVAIVLGVPLLILGVV